MNRRFKLKDLIDAADEVTVDGNIIVAVEPMEITTDVRLHTDEQNTYTVDGFDEIALDETATAVVQGYFGAIPIPRAMSIGFYKKRPLRVDDLPKPEPVVLQDQPIGYVDKATPGGFLYPKDVVLNSFRDLKVPALTGVYPPPDMTQRELSVASKGAAFLSHSVQDVRVDEAGCIRANVRVLNTPRGEALLEAYNKQECHFGIRSIVEESSIGEDGITTVKKMTIVSVDALDKEA